MTGYVDAFKQLGYQISSPRNQVSAEKPDGIAVSIWRKELQVTPAPSAVRMSFDTRSVDGWDESRMPLSGNKWRKTHLRHALEYFDGRVDVVLWNGKDAEAWLRGGQWQITFFDEATGHHRIELMAIPQTDNRETARTFERIMARKGGQPPIAGDEIGG